MKKAAELFVGIDLSKAWLAIAVHEQAESYRAENNDAGIASLVKRMKKLKPTLIVLEPTGGFEMLVVAELTHAGLPVVAINAKRVSDFARATGQLAKTDKLDAKVLAHFAAAVRPALRTAQPGARTINRLVDPSQAGFGHVDYGKEPFGDSSRQNAFSH